MVHCSTIERHITLASRVMTKDKNLEEALIGTCTPSATVPEAPRGCPDSTVGSQAGLGDILLTNLQIGRVAHVLWSHLLNGRLVRPLGAIFIKGR